MGLMTILMSRSLVQMSSSGLDKQKDDVQKSCPVSLLRDWTSGHRTCLDLKGEMG